MTLPIEIKPLLAANQGGYQISRSLRFRSSASAYLNRTFSTPTNQKKWTLSCWVKRGTFSSSNDIFNGAQSGTNDNYIRFTGNNGLVMGSYNGAGTDYGIVTTAVFRDPSAWYHCVFVYDVDNATSADRAIIYVNGVRQAVSNNANGMFPSGYTSASWNTAVSHRISSNSPSATFADQYLAEMIFVDGQALTPSSFGETDAVTGVWKPKRYTGTYGNNGFYLPFPNSNTGTAITANYLVVAGGGGGGGQVGGGGGAGGFLTGTTSLNSSLTYAVTVGAGGTGGVGSVARGTNGGNSVFSSITATGGGAGGNYNSGQATGVSGGSGGGGSGEGSAAGGSGTSGQGNAGGSGVATNWAGGGGGGASAVGANGTANVGGVGGAGTASSISGSSVTYAGGGGGASNSATASAGGSGGGGAGGGSTTIPATAGTANRGGGGGGSRDNGNGGAGGSGVVIVSYAGAQRFSGGTITSSGGNTIHTFTTSGALTAIFNDFSGNGNNWTGNNFNVSDTTAVTYDSMIDVPTQYADGGNGRGNYAVANPVNAASGLTVSDGNLRIAASAGGSKFVNSSIALPASGAYYAEITCNNATTNLIGQSIGVQAASRGLTSAQNAANAYLFYGTNAGILVSNTTTTASGLSAISANEVFQVAIDVTNSKMWIGRSNVWYNSTGGTTGNPSTGANPTFTAAFVDYFIYSGFDTGSAVSANFNFGQRPFTYTPPTGFKALNTLNLPAPTILKGNQYMNVVTYTATPGTGNTISGVGFQTDLLWTKNRDNAEQHYWQDSVRGFSPSAGVTQMLSSNSTAAETSLAGITCTTTSDGFTVVDSAPASGEFWFTNRTYVAWCWKEGATQGFDIVTYTGDATTNRTVAHSLGVTPSMFIIKARSAGTTSWITHHKDLGNNGGSPPYLRYLELNTTAIRAASTSLLPVAGLSSTTFPTSGATNNTNVNGSGTTYVAYLFSEVAGYSKFGSYTGNGSADGPFVFCGFRPRWVMIKRTDTTNNWIVYDSSRSSFNAAAAYLFPDLANVEGTGSGSSDLLDFLSNGFKLRCTTLAENASGGTYIFAAFAENPFKNALAR